MLRTGTSRRLGSLSTSGLMFGASPATMREHMVSAYTIESPALTPYALVALGCRMISSLPSARVTFHTARGTRVLRKATTSREAVAKSGYGGSGLAGSTDIEGPPGDRIRRRAAMYAGAAGLDSRSSAAVPRGFIPA